MIKTWLGRLAALELWVVLGVVAASVVFPALLPWAAGIPLVFWPLRRIGRGRWTVRTPADLPIFALLLTLPVTMWVTALPETTLPQVYRLLSGVGLYYAAVNWAVTPARLRTALRAGALAGAGLAAFAPFSVQWALDKIPFIPDSIYTRFSVQVADAVHPNVMAGSMALLLPLGAALVLLPWREIAWWERGLWLLAAGPSLVILGLTQSRGAAMGLTAALLLMAALRWRWGWLGLALAGGGSAWVVREIGGRRLLDFLTAGRAISGLEGRIEIWARAIYMLEDFSFTGVGMGLFTEVADRIYPFFLAQPGAVRHAHNLFLQVGVDLGVPGLIAWLAVLFASLAAAWQAWRAGRARRDGWLAAAGIGLLGAQAALLVHGLTDAVTWGMVRPAPLVWAVWALAAAAGGLAETRPAPDQADAG